jgi:hypothetical protein
LNKSLLGVSLEELQQLGVHGGGCSGRAGNTLLVLLVLVEAEGLQELEQDLICCLSNKEKYN